MREGSTFHCPRFPRFDHERAALDFRWDTKLGFQRQRSFPVRLCTLAVGGEAAACTEVFILRRFATRYLVTGPGDRKRVLTETEDDEEARVRVLNWYAGSTQSRA